MKPSEIRKALSLPTDEALGLIAKHRDNIEVLNMAISLEKLGSKNRKRLLDKLIQWRSQL